MGRCADAFDRSLSDPEGFWGEAAKDIDWSQAPSVVLDASNPPFYRWFADGVMNGHAVTAEQASPIRSTGSIQHLPADLLASWSAFGKRRQPAPVYPGCDVTGYPREFPHDGLGRLESAS
jgi:Acetyl-coenzyme A synthetase N-terminus